MKYYFINRDEVIDWPKQKFNVLNVAYNITRTDMTITVIIHKKDIDNAKDIIFEVADERSYDYEYVNAVQYWLHPIDKYIVEEFICAKILDDENLPYFEIDAMDIEDFKELEV